MGLRLLPLPPRALVLRVHRRPPTYKIQQCIHAGSGRGGREKKLSFLAPAPPPVHVRITLCASRLCAGAMRAVSGAGGGATFFEAVSQFSISSLFLSSLGSFQRAVARARGGRGGWLTYPPMHTVSAGKTQCVRAIPEGGERGPLGKSAGEQGNGETINAENPERSLCPSVIFSDWRRESSLCAISSPFLLACASGATRKQGGVGGLFRCCQNHTFAARMCGRAAFLLPFFRKVSSSFPTTAKSERQSNFSKFVGSSLPPCAGGVEMHCVHIGVTRAFPREGEA